MSVRQGAGADVRPVTFEIPAAGAAAWLFASLLILPAGRGVAGWLFGGGWVWPMGTTEVVRSIGGLARGRAGRGLTSAQIGKLPGAGSIYVCIAAGELLLIAVTVWASVLWWRHLGPGAWQGMADRFEVESVLGVSRLRKARKVIRPDLYGQEGRNSAGTEA